jgi:hypothetical protein
LSLGTEVRQSYRVPVLVLNLIRLGGKKLADVAAGRAEISIHETAVCSVHDPRDI